ncbi:PAS domain S-box protein [Denitromonas iodatirespirans]|uniref:PAS domain S-box protein n=1 Tax=Denitromonas iodatirespirans TaxID=2795389 RepID=A0A944DB96_DENI1|nr:PAS domain S-box protein [Denitromonas iodatirespirans]MBT0963140.1 PAS domain S-box protein [Denitromonas iodatirespirans]
MSESSRRVWLFRFVVVLAAYVVGGRIGLTVPYIGSHISLIWPPTGIALAALLRWNLSLWPAIWLGAFGVNLSVGSSVELAAGIAAGNTLGPWLAARLLRGQGFDCDLPARRDLVRYLVIGVAAGMALNAGNGVAQLWLAGLLPTSALGAAWSTWWLGDAMGALVVGIPLLTASRSSWRDVWLGARGGEVGAILLLTLGTGAWLFLGDAVGKPANPLLYLPFFLLSWLAIRGGATVASTAALLLSAQAVWATAAGGGPFYAADLHLSLAMLWGYMATATVITVLLTVLVGELRTSERRLTLATVGGALGLWEWHLPTDRMTYTGDWRAALGVTAAQLGVTRDDWLQTIHADDRSEVAHKLAAHLAASTELFEAEFRMDGMFGPTWVQARGQVVERTHGGAPVRMAGTMLDVNARRQAEEALQASKERWRFALEGARDGVWDWDLQTGELYLSERDMAILGYEGEDGAHSHIDQWAERVHPDDRAVRHAALAQYLAGEAPLYTCECRLRGRDGRWRWLQTRGRVASRAADGTALRLIGTHTDISERKRSEEIRQRQLVSLQALNEIGTVHHAGLPEELSAILSIGAKHFGVEFGIVSHIDGDDYTVAAHVSPADCLAVGQRFSLGNTYCALTLARDGVLAIAHMGASAHLGHPCYQAFRLETYIGVPLRVGGAVYGTLSFSSPVAYERVFDERDEEFMLLLGRWVAAAIERNQAQRALAESEEKLRGLFELSPLGIVRCDMAGRFIEFNAAFLRICGYTEDALKALDYRALVLEADAADDRRRAEALERSGYFAPVEKALVRKDGDRLTVQCTGMLVTGRDGQRSIWSIVEDITERRQAEARLREQKEFLSTILENEPECVKVVGADGVVRTMNSAGLAMLEADSVDEINTHGLINFVEPGFRGAFEHLNQRVLSGESATLEFRLQGRRGTRRWLETHAAPLHDAAGGGRLILAVTRDVSRRREAEERLALSLRGADLAMTDWHIPSGRITFGEGWTRLLGYDARELSAERSPLTSLVRAEDAPVMRDALVRHLKGETPYLEAEVRMRHTAGHWVWVLARGMAVERSADGRAVRVAGTAMDISARKQAEGEIRRLSQWNELLLNSAGEGIYGVDINGRCTFINPAALAMLGFEREEVLGQNPHTLFHVHDRDASPDAEASCPIAVALRDGVRREAEDAFLRKSGERFPVSMTATPLREDDRIVGAEVVFQDIGERKAMEQELVRLATTDALTGVANRRRFLEQLEMELARAKRFGQPATLLMLDIDHFKRVNDTYGHATGDAVLQHFARLTQQRLRRIDLFGRLGGEEFAILLTGTDGAGARHFSEQFRRAVAQTPAAAKGEISISVSIGVAEFDPQEPTPDTLLARGDVALYRAKAGGRNRIELS